MFIVKKKKELLNLFMKNKSKNKMFVEKSKCKFFKLEVIEDEQIS